MILTRQDFRFIATGYFVAVLFLAYYLSQLIHFKYILISIIGLIGLHSLFYNINTNHLVVAQGQPQQHYSSARREQYGYEAVTKVIGENVETAISFV